MSLRSRKLLLATTCLVCALLLGYLLSGLEGSEFTGGTITGPIFRYGSNALLLFMLAIAVSFFWPKISAIAAILAAITGFPLYFYFAMPLVFRSIFHGEYSTWTSHYFAPDFGAWFGLLTLATAIVISVYELSSSKAGASPRKIRKSQNS